jgi:hypothetical protein
MRTMARTKNKAIGVTEWVMQNGKQIGDADIWGTLRHWQDTWANGCQMSLMRRRLSRTRLTSDEQHDRRICIEVRER